MISTEQAERIRLAAGRLAAAETELMHAREKYRRALREFDLTSQTRLEEGVQKP